MTRILLTLCWLFSSVSFAGPKTIQISSCEPTLDSQVTDYFLELASRPYYSFNNGYAINLQTGLPWDFTRRPESGINKFFPLYEPQMEGRTTIGPLFNEQIEQQILGQWVALPVLSPESAYLSTSDYFTLKQGDAAVSSPRTPYFAEGVVVGVRVATLPDNMQGYSFLAQTPIAVDILTAQGSAENPNPVVQRYLLSEASHLYVFAEGLTEDAAAALRTVNWLTTEDKVLVHQVSPLTMPNQMVYPLPAYIEMKMGSFEGQGFDLNQQMAEKAVIFEAAHGEIIVGVVSEIAEPKEEKIEFFYRRVSRQGFIETSPELARDIDVEKLFVIERR